VYLFKEVRSQYIKSLLLFIVRESLTLSDLVSRSVWVRTLRRKKKEEEMERKSRRRSRKGKR
jgi:hypothetical protein